MPLSFYILNCLEILLINQAKLIIKKQTKIETFLVGLVHQFVLSSKKKKKQMKIKTYFGWFFVMFLVQDMYKFEHLWNKCIQNTEQKYWVFGYLVTSLNMHSSSPLHPHPPPPQKGTKPMCFNTHLRTWMIFKTKENDSFYYFFLTHKKNI